MKVAYLTDGIPRKINIAEQTITFKQTAPKNFAFKGEITPLVVSALKEIGKDNVTNEDAMQIQKMLKHESKDIVLSDAQIAPRWITNVVINTKFRIGPKLNSDFIQKKSIKYLQ